MYILSLRLEHNTTVLLFKDDKLLEVVSQDGHPLVEVPDQAIFILENSNLQYLAIENWLISKI